MTINELVHGNTLTLSFEIFPPKTEKGMVNLFNELEKLSVYKPDFISVTYGAGGSTRDKTLDIALAIREKFEIFPLAHFTCVGSGRKDIQDYISKVEESGVCSILALRGDPPAGEKNFTPPADGFAYANQLVTFIRQFFDGTIAVAGYPEGHVESPSFEADIENLKKKVDAGADFIMTQLFFDNQDMFRYLDILEKNNITLPVIPGIMPVTAIGQVQRSIEMSGAAIPASLKALMEKGYSEEDFFKAGTEYTINQCRELMGSSIGGFHFYTLNKSTATGMILDELNFR